ncbi:MAG TPA: Hsp20/alpha crystallin family protein [Pyrinomonadaceae bacterium]|jgi:HSP20 family protein|nr:Hsp20/alpha crystallin family protein [Pyrinomonadaceae bacterium]
MAKVLHAPAFKRVELEQLRERVGRLLVMLQEATDDIAPPVPGALLPPVDVCESEEGITVRVELPGVPAELIEVALTTHHLRITGKKKKGAPRGRIAHLCSERNYGHFNRTVPLRWPVNVREATAELRNGLLTLHLPKLKDRRGAEFIITVTSDE